MRNVNKRRRRVLAGLGSGLAGVMAGCSSESNPTQTGTDQPTTEPETQSTTTTAPENIPEGGMPRTVTSSSPDTVNVLATTAAASWNVLSRIYTFGTVSHPETLEIVPWACKNWELKPENIGTSDPTITTEWRDDLTFSDGEKVTAEDIKFTVDYIKEQGPAGTISASDFSSVEEVQIDSKDGTTVHYYLSEKDNAWAVNILGQIVLPKHIWKDVSDYSKYDPLKNDELIGSGPMALEDYNRDNWYQMTMRDQEAIPWHQLDHVDWLHPDGPFIDGLRLEILDSRQSVEQSILNGEVELAPSVSVSKAADATQKDYLNVMQSSYDGWWHHSFNLRRKPFDDKAFRQFLVKLYNQHYTVNQIYEGIGAKFNHYPTPTAYQEWRPPDPTTVEEYEGIELPTLGFPGDKETNELSQEAVDDAREFLINHEEAKYDYSIGEASTDLSNAPDGNEIYIDGEPIPDVHTDNDGNEGQGPLRLSYYPPNSYPLASRISGDYSTNLKAVGLPIQDVVESFGSQFPRVAAQEDFDLFGSGWVGFGVSHTWLSQLFGPAGRDPDSEIDAQMFNMMNYSGADELIKEQKKLMSLDERKPYIRKIFAKIWQDAPTFITHESVLLNPLHTSYTGHVKSIGGPINNNTLMNMHQSE